MKLLSFGKWKYKRICHDMISILEKNIENKVKINVIKKELLSQSFYIVSARVASLDSTGVANDLNKAYVKCIFELFERYLFDNFSFFIPSSFEKTFLEKKKIFSSTNGLALHLNRRDAIQNSQSELCERYIIMSSVFSMRNIVCVQSVYDYSEGLTFDFFQYLNNSKKIITSCIAKKDDMYFAIGHGCSNTYNDSIQKALYECIPILNFNLKRTISLDKIFIERVFYSSSKINRTLEPDYLCHVETITTSTFNQSFGLDNQVYLSKSFFNFFDKTDMESYEYKMLFS